MRDNVNRKREEKYMHTHVRTLTHTHTHTSHTHITTYIRTNITTTYIISYHCLHVLDILIDLKLERDRQPTRWVEKKRPLTMSEIYRRKKFAPSCQCRAIVFRVPVRASKCKQLSRTKELNVFSHYAQEAHAVQVVRHTAGATPHYSSWLRT